MKAPPSRLRVVVAAVSGNALEWYDFILYALLAPYIAATFFPAHDPEIALLLAIGTFGVSFVMRPVGALVLGQYADRHGRRPALTLVIALMTLATFLIVFTPGWRSIGYAAPVMIIGSRLLQGFSVGGELGSSTAVLFEAAPAGRRGFFSSWQGTSQLMASLAATSAGALLTTFVPHRLLLEGYWRLPFALGLLIAPVGLYLRAVLHDPAAVSDRLQRSGAPLRLLWSAHRAALVRCIGLIAISTMATYAMELGMPAYAHRVLGLPLRDALVANLVALTAGLVISPLSGALSDRVGARAIMLPTVVLLALAAVPAFWLLGKYPTFGTLMAVQVFCLILRTAMTGPIYGLIGALFPVEVRSSGVAVSYNTSVLLFGGFAPVITLWLVDVTGDHRMPGLYVMAGGVITLAALLVRWPGQATRPQP